jgi:hypothetical protein
MPLTIVCVCVCVSKLLTQLCCLVGTLLEPQLLYNNKYQFSELTQASSVNLLYCLCLNLRNNQKL